jgi:membrane associated rhomboid family serine protease
MNNSIFDDIKNVFKSNNYLYQIIIANAVVFLFLNVALAITPPESSNTIKQFFGLSADFNTYYWRVWTYFTYMFTHIGFRHLFFNMLLLYMLGQVLADLYGQKRLLLTYIFGGLLGGLLYMLSAFVIPNVSPDSYLIGASAGVMAVIIAIGFLQPSYMMQIFTYRVQLKYVVLVAFILSSVLYLDTNTGGKVAHFGGALYGFLFAYYLPKGLDINLFIEKLLSSLTGIFKSKSKIKVVHKNKSHAKSNTSKASQAEVDKILDKISKSGYDSLTKTEKEFLFNFK